MSPDACLVLDVIGHVIIRNIHSYVSNFNEKLVLRMGLSRMVDHMKPTLRPKSDQEFSHSLSEERTLTPCFLAPKQRVSCFRCAAVTTATSIKEIL